MKQEKIEITLTDALPKDAKDLLEFYKQVGSETAFLEFGSEGLGLNQEQEQRYLKQLQENNNNRVIIARLGDEVIGVASIGASAKPKVAHVGEIGICILQRFWGFGLSHVLMEDLLDWAAENDVLRVLRLEVSAENIRAIKLYEKYDFETVGRIPQGIKAETDYQETLIMTKQLDNEENAQG